MTTPNLDRARTQMAAVDLARRWAAADRCFRDLPLTVRETALMHLALRCLLDPGLVERQLADLTAPKENR